MTAPSGRRRHSFIQFYMDDWSAGTANLTRLVKSVYFDVCLYNWDKAEPMPRGEFKLVTIDLGGQGGEILDLLIEAGKLEEDEHGNVYSPRALAEAQRAFSAWEAKSRGGRKGKSEESSDTLPAKPKDSSKSVAAEPEPDPEPDPEGESKASPPPRANKLPREALKMIVDAWNDMARKSKLSPIQKMTSEREGKLRARAEEHGVDTLIQAIETIPRSKFLTGQKTDFKMDFNSFLRPDNCVKLIEGGYHNEGEGGKNAWTGR